MAYSNAPADKLYGLLPAFVREQDAEAGEPLRALLRVVEQGADLIEGDIAQLANNAFVETAEPWAVPYIGELIGWTPLAGSAGEDGTARELFPDLAGPTLAPAGPYRPRADVGKTIGYRRRKGTLPMLEQLARDVTGWPAHAVEGFALAGWTQWLRNHQRPMPGGTADLRSPDRAGTAHGPFDAFPHSIDVRAPAAFEGRIGIWAVSFFLWRLLSLPVASAMPRRAAGVGDWAYRFSPLGQDAPLFARGRVPAVPGAAVEADLLGPIRPAHFHADLVAHGGGDFTDFYGAFAATADRAAAPSPSIGLTVGGEPVPAGVIRCADLSVWRQPPDDLVLVDVARGRLAVGPAWRGALRVDYHEGRVAAMGGGSYARPGWMARHELVGRLYLVGEDAAHDSVGAALAAWVADGRPDATVRILDQRSYAEAIAIDVEGAAGTRLAIEAADGARPHLRLDGPLRLTGRNDAFGLTLSGLLVEGRVEVAGSIRRLRLLHTTLVPGGSIAADEAVADPDVPSVLVSGDDTANLGLSIELAFACTGALAAPEHVERIVALDSIVDGRGGAAITGVEGLASDGPALRLERVTVLGGVRVRAIPFASEVIFDGSLEVARTQAGCVRFSFVPAEARTPRRYRCQPDLAERRALEAAGALGAAARGALVARVRGRVRPGFAERRYGQPAYLQLADSCPAEIREGAESGSEIGAFAQVGGAIREANLRVRLDEYLPFGLEAGLVHAT